MEKPNYFAMMPASVRYDEKLKPMEKIIYAEITALVNIKGFCYATNQYFSKLYGVHKNTISIWINNLMKYGYIKVKYVVREVEGQKRQERRIYIVKERGTKKAEEGFQEKIVEEEKKECIVTDFLGDKEVEEKEKITKKIERGTSKKLGDSQEKNIAPINKKGEENNTSILLQDEYITHTNTEEKNLQVIREILKKYRELGLPEYEFTPDNYIILNSYGVLGAKKLFEALELMAESKFVKRKMSVDTIFKIENLKKALNGSFKDDSFEKVEKKILTKEEIEKNIKEKEERERRVSERERALDSFLSGDLREEEEIKDIFTTEELFGKK